MCIFILLSILCFKFLVNFQCFCRKIKELWYTAVKKENNLFQFCFVFICSVINGALCCYELVACQIFNPNSSSGCNDIHSSKDGKVKERRWSLFKLHWLIWGDRQSAVRGEYCMFGKLTDAGLTIYEIFKVLLWLRFFVQPEPEIV